MIDRWSIGDVTVTAIADLDPFDLALNRLLPAANPAQLAPYRDLLVPDHLDEEMKHIRLAVRTFLLRVDGQNILIDTCVGEHKPRPRLEVWNNRSDTPFIQRLVAAGVHPEAVDVVFCTHLHADHVGWNTLQRDGRWVPSFPRATYLFGRSEFEHWTQHPDANHGAFLDSVLPVAEAGQMQLVDDGYSLANGVTLLPLPGHSPGQMGLSIERGATKALFCGDAIHSPVQILEPQWSSAFCADAACAVQTRLQILEAAAESRSLLVPAHFRQSGRVRIEQGTAGGFRPVFA